MSALPRRSTHTMIGETLSMARRTIAIFSDERAMSVASKGMTSSREHGRFPARSFDAAENLVVADGLSLGRIRREDLLLAALQIDERPFLFRMNGRREEDVGGVVERMRGV